MNAKIQKAELTPRETFEALSDKLGGIALAISCLNTSMFSDSALGELIYTEIGKNNIGHIHQMIEKSLIWYVLIEIIKLFDENPESISLLKILNTVEHSAEKCIKLADLKTSYYKLKSDHKFQRIKAFRDKAVAHNSNENVKTQFTQTKEFYESNLEPYFKDLFSFFYEGNIKYETLQHGEDLAKSYFEHLLFGIKARKEDSTKYLDKMKLIYEETNRES